MFLDYNHNRIIFEPAATFNQPFDRAHSGLALSGEGKDYTTFRITEVLEDSPASEAGLQKDDLIIKVNDRPAAELTITKLGEMFGTAGNFQDDNSPWRSDTTGDANHEKHGLDLGGEK